MFSGIDSPTPFDLRFSLFGVPVRVHPFHWIFSAVLGWFFFTYGGFGYLAMWVGCVFVSVLLHEMGHVLTGRLFGSDGHILLYSLGGVAIGSSDLRKRWQRILVYLAGPFTQFVLLGLVFLGDLNLTALVGPNWQKPLAALFFMLFLINLIWPVMNLLPIWPLDGGQICREILEALFGHRGVIASLWISILLAGFIAVQVLLNRLYPEWELIPHVSHYFKYIGGMWTAIFFAMFAINSFQALQMERSRSRWDDELPWER